MVLILFRSGMEESRLRLEGSVASGLRGWFRFYFHSWVAVDGLHGEGGQADGDVLSSALVRSGVLNPLATVGDDGLSGGDIEGSRFVLDSQRAFEDDGKFDELRSLAGLLPSLRTAHVGHAQRGGFGIDATDVFVDEFRLVA